MAQDPTQAMIAVNAQADRLVWDRQALGHALSGLEAGAPVTVMIHGFRFEPGHPRHCPHRHILAERPSLPRAISWPRHLHLGRDSCAGLGIAFGWAARGTLWQAYDRAALSARALAELIGAIRALRPGPPVQIVAHSMGARVALQALPLLPAGVVGTVILMAAAEFRGAAQRAMASPAGRAAQVVNVTSRENDVFDFALEWAVSLGSDTAVGHGLAAPLPNWVDVQLDQAATLRALARAGYRVEPRATRICHWSPYLRPGVFALYRALLQGRLAPETLRALLPERGDARWSRLMPVPRASAPLPLGANAS